MKIGITLFIGLLFLVMPEKASMAADKTDELKINYQAPVFNATDFNGNAIDLTALLKDGPIVLVFLRSFS